MRRRALALLLLLLVGLVTAAAVQHVESLDGLTLYTIEDGQIYFSQEFSRAFMRALLRHHWGGAEGPYLRLAGDQIVGAPARPRGDYDQTAGPVVLSTSESVLAQVTANVAVGGRVALWGRCGLVKDSGTTVRVVTGVLRRGSTAAAPQVGLPLNARSANVASSDFGPLVFVSADNPGAGAHTYSLMGSAAAGAPSAVACELVAMEVE